MAKKVYGKIYSYIKFRTVIDNYETKTSRPLSYKEALSLCKLAKRLVADIWEIIQPQTEEEIKRFYKSCIYYPFENAFELYMHKHQLNFRKEIYSCITGRDVLDFGGE